MELYTPPSDSACFDLRFRRDISSSHSSSSSSLSPPDLNSGSSEGQVVTPDSEADGDTETVVPKLEDTDDHYTLASLTIDVKPIPDADADADDDKILVPLTPPKKGRGRPRKHPVVSEQKKTTHARSKTGCGTCRKRKKKCDEARPFCTNCEKNNVVCDGYELKQQWRPGRQKALISRSTIPTGVSLLNPCIEGMLDVQIYEYYTSRMAKLLSLTDTDKNPFLDFILPIAWQDEGLLHSVLSLSATSLLLQSPASDSRAYEDRFQHHYSAAIRMLSSDIRETLQADINNQAAAPVKDATIAQTLLLCLQTVCAGDTEGQHLSHLKAMKSLLVRQKRFSSEHLRDFILEFFVYHDSCSHITNLQSEQDIDSRALMKDFNLPQYMMQPQAGNLLGVLDGLFGFISQIRGLRDVVRQHCHSPDYGRLMAVEIMPKALEINSALREWTPRYSSDNPRYQASLLYHKCTNIYLERTIKPSRASDEWRERVEECLELLRQLPWERNDLSVQSILLMPLFLLGCAAFDARQRPEIDEALQRLQDWSNLGNIAKAREIVKEIWQMMDDGREEDTWDWETLIHKREWSFLIT